MADALNARTASTRRAFLKGAAVAAAPVAAAGTAAAIAASEHHARLARLEAEAQIRLLHQAWLRQVNAGDGAEAARLHHAVVRVSPDLQGPPDEISLAADGRRAEGRFHLVVETETPRPLDCTLAQMAAAQGEGMIRSTARRRVTADYVKTEQGWAIRTLTLQDA